MRYGRGLNLLVTGLIVGAVLWDLAAGFAPLPVWWPVVSYTGLAAAVAVGCFALVIELLRRRPGEPRPRGTVVRLFAIGLVLGAWLLRGHPEIPPDPPLVAAAGLAALLFAAQRVPLRLPARFRKPAAGPVERPPAD
jgi:hypothetical protein